MLSTIFNLLTYIVSETTYFVDIIFSTKIGWLQVQNMILKLRVLLIDLIPVIDTWIVDISRCVNPLVSINSNSLLYLL